MECWFEKLLHLWTYTLTCTGCYCLYTVHTVWWWWFFFYHKKSSFVWERAAGSKTKDCWEIQRSAFFHSQLLVMKTWMSVGKNTIISATISVQVDVCVTWYRIQLSKCNFPLYRWPLPPSTRSLPPRDARTDGSRSQSLCPHGRTHSDRPRSSRSSNHCDRTAGGNVPDLAGADCVSALSAGNHHPHLPRCRAHEHTFLPLLLLCRVSRLQDGSPEKIHLIVVCGGSSSKYTLLSNKWKNFGFKDQACGCRSL